MTTSPGSCRSARAPCAWPDTTYLSWRGWPAWREQFLFDQALLLQAAHIDASPDNLWRLVERMITSTLWLGTPFFATLVIVAVLANVVQTGPVFSFEPLKADLTRINPVSGLKNVFSMQLLFNAARTVIKLVFLSAAVWFVLEGMTSQFYFLAGLAPIGFVRLLLSDFASLGLKLALVLWAIALIDLKFTRSQ